MKEEGNKSKFAIKYASLSASARRSLLNSPQRKVRMGQMVKYYDLLSNFEFLAAKIRHPEFGVEALIEDYYLMAQLDEELPGRDAETESALGKIQRTLEMSAHILKNDQTQLAGQLLGRLLPPPPPPYKYFWERLPTIGKFLPKYSPSHLLNKPLLKKNVSKKTLVKSYPAIHKLLIQAKQYQDTPWLCPLAANLTPPGGPLIRTLTGHTDYVTAVALTPDGTKAVSGSDDKTLKIWDLATGKELATLDDKTLKIWDLARGKELATLIGHTSYVKAVALTPDGTKAVLGSYDNTLKIWDLARGKELATLTGHTSFVNAVALTPDGTKAVSGSYDNTLKIWDLVRGEEEVTFTGDSNFICCAISSDGKTIVAGDSGGIVHFLRMEGV